MSDTVKINLGCGSRSRDGWINFDSSASRGVISHDLLDPLPLPDETVDFVYLSHVFEHFTRRDGSRLLEDIRRVLKPGGHIRVVVPDLELLARNYLAALTSSRGSAKGVSTDHEWAVLTMFDQVSRGIAGGEMLGFLASHPASNLDRVFALEGPEIRSLHRRLSSTSTAPRIGRKARLKMVLTWLTAPFRAETWLGDNDQEALRLGRFRRGGEVHYWMYDEVTLSDVLKQGGFTDTVRCAANQSALPGWVNEHLDTEPDGTVYKPTSLFMEARKPSKNADSS
jgi:SAM-dependent methyltransferase